MNKQMFRHITQVLSLLLLILIPVFECYKTMLFYIAPGQAGYLWSSADYILSDIPDGLNGGYLSPLITGLDFFAGLISGNNSTLQEFFGFFGGTYWSVTFFGLTVVDPLAFLQTISFTKSVSPGFILAVIIPIAFAVILGRAFCSWLCPINSLFEFSRFICRKVGLKPLEKNLISGSYAKYLLLLAGLLLPFFGLVFFPYVLPYVLLGRVFYHLTLSNILWSAICFIAGLMIIDTFFQRGFWCNYLCPTGAFLGLLGLRRLVNVKHNSNNCIESCSLCTKSCPWNAEPKVRFSLNCTNCGRCVDSCPGNALSFSSEIVTDETSEVNETEERVTA